MTHDIRQMPQLHAAIRFATERHRGQSRKDAAATPYIAHPLAVAGLLVEAGVEDLVALQAAVLHDTIEDTHTTREELEALFGADVASVVAELSDDKQLDAATRKQLQVEHACGKSPSAARVKVADKTCNLRDIAHAPPVGWSDERKRAYFEWARRVVNALPPVEPALLTAFEAAYRRKPSASAAMEAA